MVINKTEQQEKQHLRHILTVIREIIVTRAMHKLSLTSAGDITGLIGTHAPDTRILS